MKPIVLASILLLAGLAACNIPTLPAGDLTPAPQEAAPIDTPIPVVPIPVTAIDIDGVPYDAYQVPGDPFRFVCQTPCPLELDYIYAEYAGFRAAHAMLIEWTGVDTLPELQPVDMHLVFEDSTCSFHPSGHAFVYPHTHQAYTCTDGPGYYPTLEEKIAMASQVDGQYFPLHEYMHTIYFGRLSGYAGGVREYKAEFMHDFVVPVPSFAAGLMDPAEFCTYGDLWPSPGDYGGKLITELCRQNGFEWQDLAPSLIALDDLYTSGAGQVEQADYEHPAPTVAQYRDILNDLLGSDTTQAFADACFPPVLFGNTYTLSPACVTPGGTATPLK